MCSRRKAMSANKLWFLNSWHNIELILHQIFLAIGLPFIAKRNILLSLRGIILNSRRNSDHHDLSHFQSSDRNTKITSCFNTIQSLHSQFESSLSFFPFLIFSDLFFEFSWIVVHAKSNSYFYVYDFDTRCNHNFSHPIHFESFRWTTIKCNRKLERWNRSIFSYRFLYENVLTTYYERCIESCIHDMENVWHSTFIDTLIHFFTDLDVSDSSDTVPSKAKSKVIKKNTIETNYFNNLAI